MLTNIDHEHSKIAKPYPYKVCLCKGPSIIILESDSMFSYLVAVSKQSIYLANIFIVLYIWLGDLVKMQAKLQLLETLNRKVSVSEPMFKEVSTCSVVV